MGATLAHGLSPRCLADEGGRAQPAAFVWDAPCQISALWPRYVPVWSHRSVSKAWNRAVVVGRLRAAFRARGTLVDNELLNVSHGYFDAGVDYVSRRVELELPEPGPLASQAGVGNVLLEGPARMTIVRGTTDCFGAQEAVAEAMGRYVCEVGGDERALVQVQTTRVTGLGVGRSESVSLPVYRFVSRIAPDTD